MNILINKINDENLKEELFNLVKEMLEVENEEDL